MIENYVRWLERLYANRTGIPPNDLGEISAGVRVLRHHARRLPREEDFISLVAEEMAQRLKHGSDDELDHAIPPPFLKLLDRSADAVRHRIVREAQRQPAPIRDEVPDRRSISDRLSQLLTAELSPEENLVVQAMLAGNKPDEVARRLGVSLRTVYRRIKQVRQRLEEGDG